MSEEFNLSPEEAETFFELNEKLNEDMNAAFEAANPFDEIDEDNPYLKAWDGSRTELYQTCQRRHIRKFVRRMYGIRTTSGE